MSKNVLHVIPHEEQWAVKREGNERVSSMAETQQDAINIAQSYAQPGDDIVIHRPDGTIRERNTISESNSISNKDGNNDPSKPQPYEVMSVGSRISWGAVLAGAVVSIAIYMTLTMLAIALGITTIDEVQIKVFAVSAVVIVIFNLLVSLFIGGLVVSQLTVGENKTESLIYGLLLWGVLFVVVLLTGSGLGLGLPMANTDQTVDQVPAPADLVEKLGLNDEQQRKYQEMAKEADQVVDKASPTTMAWIGFSSVVLSIFAAIAGAVTGAGPQLVLRQLRGSRMEVVKSS